MIHTTIFKNHYLFRISINALVINIIISNNMASNHSQDLFYISNYELKN